MNFYKHFMGDYARDTAHLSMIEHGAYRVMLDTYYATAKPLPAGKEALYRIAKAFSAAERRAVDTVADQFFPVNGDGFRHNHRADLEIEKERQYTEAQRGRANRRWGNPESMPPHMPPHMPDDMQAQCRDGCRNDATTATVKQSQKLLPDGKFLSFWQSWPKGPRKASKGKCFALWKRQNLEEKADEILAHVEAMKQSREWRDGYIPAPIIYLKEERWDGAETESDELRVAL